MIIYITTQGSRLSLDEGRVNISQPEGMTRSIPKEQIESISIFGKVQITSDVINHCLSRGIPINYFSGRGKYFGRTYTTSHSDIYRLKQQIKLSENEDFALELSKNIVSAKVNNQITLLRRYEKTRNNLTDIIKEMSIVSRKIKSANNLSELRGFEGYIARLYFGGISKCINPIFEFKGRNRQPPKDPFNSLISLGYTILLNEIVGNLEAVGLNPFCGFLHEDRERHPTLASDLIEEFRTPLVDSLALNLCNNKLKEEDFYKEDEAVFLEKETLKIYLEELENKMNISQNYRQDDSPSTFRRTIGLQCRDLVRAIKEEDPSQYKPLWTR
ncbi:MAG: CRISPR-associated endonuclease Cas1 [Tissierellia bacterium]|nr:CRISPR-associated endonuclease Cas1 [Tissierellia bacterium]